MFTDAEIAAYQSNLQALQASQGLAVTTQWDAAGNPIGGGLSTVGELGPMVAVAPGNGGTLEAAGQLGGLSGVTIAALQALAKRLGYTSIIGFLTGLAGGALPGLLGGGAGDLSPGGHPVGGPGVPEPRYGVVKQWNRLVTSRTENYWIYFFRMSDGHTMLYNPRKGWKHWRDYKSIVIGKSLTSKNVRQVSKRLRRHAKDLSGALAITTPAARRRRTCPPPG